MRAKRAAENPKYLGLHSTVITGLLNPARNSVVVPRYVPVSMKTQGSIALISEQNKFFLPS
jgi:hypothetical protein